MPIPSISALRTRLRMRHLLLLRALEQKGSLRSAAGLVAVSQPAATKTLQELEEIVGTALFIRQPRGLVPTVFGEAITRYAITVLEDMEALRDELAALEGGDIGRVRVGAIPAAAPGLLTQATVALRAAYPRLELAIQVDTSDILVQALNHGQLDLVIGRVPAEWPDEHLSFTHLGSEALTLVARAGHPATVPSRVRPTQLRDFPWVLQPRPSPMRGVIDEIFRGWDNFHPSALIETSSTLTTLMLIRESDMIGVLPEVVGRYFLGMGALAEVRAPMAVRLPPYGLITRTNRETTPALRLVADAVIAAATEL